MTEEIAVPIGVKEKLEQLIAKSQELAKKDEMQCAEKRAAELPENAKLVAGWLKHLGITNLASVPETKHLFEATEEALKDKDTFYSLRGRILPIGKSCVLAGGAKSGKSLTCLAMAVSVATGQTLFGAFTPQKTGKVLYISYEDDIFILLDRLKHFETEDIKNKLGENLCLYEASQPLLIEIKTAEQPIMLTPAGEKIKALCASIKPVLIIVDTLSKAFSYEENNNVTANAMLSEVKELFGLNRKDKNDRPTVIYIQHLRKAEALNKADISIDSVRGAGALTADCRTVLGFKREEDCRKLLMLGANSGEDFKEIKLSCEVHMKKVSNETAGKERTIGILNKKK